MLPLWRDRAHRITWGVGEPGLRPVWCSVSCCSQCIGLGYMVCVF